MEGDDIIADRSAEMPLGALLAYHASQDPDRPAVTFNDATTSYSQLDARSNRKARQLAALGVGEGDIVTLAIPKGLEYYETVFAIWKLGATPNNVSPNLPAAELKAIVDLAKPRLVIGGEAVRGASPDFLVVGTEPDEALSADPLPLKTSPLWKIQTSGGSTGRPKLIVDNLPGLHDPANAPLGQMPGETMLNPGPMYHNTPFVMSFQRLFSGGHVVEMEKFDALRVLELIDRYKVNWVSFVPTMMSRIWRLPEEQRNSFDVSSLRMVLHMGSVCPAWLKQAWIDWLGPDTILEIYGGTELFGVTAITGREWLEHKGSVGKPIRGSEMRIFDEQGQECAPGEIGEIYFLSGGGTGSTYIGAEAKSRDGWRSYGDLGYVDADGYLYIADRRTDMIVSGGANIFPAEVEAALDEHPDVQSSIVIGLPDADLGQRAHAIVQVADEARERADDEALRAFLATKLVRYKIPRTFEFTRENLRDDAGKARRSQLRDERIASAA
ncbi:AMP-binding protein [Sphingopyxis granuli]|uniref:AMP-binding protein n=1 Tax=Sphingopyxis granuli TaxID=267128 RepID=UPI001F53C7C5|nr:AMP-binding protein [Sphingopyxis granuli]UNK79177.1 AMP-binding protein [Sphingopyxis granuli]